MESNFSHVLIFTATLFDASENPIGGTGKSDMSYDFSSYLQPDESLIDPKIKKIFHYSNIFLCQVQLDESFVALKSAKERTDSLKSLIASIFIIADSISFEWMLRQKEDVEPIIERAIGSSGGANIGSRGG